MQVAVCEEVGQRSDEIYMKLVSLSGTMLGAPARVLRTERK